MVLFTYTDYLRSKKLLQNTNLLQEEPLVYTSSNMNNPIYHKHDKLYRNLLNNKKEFYLFLQDFFNYTLHHDILAYNRNFIANNFSNNYSDVVFKLKNIPVYLLVEHQSYPDSSMPYRIYKYYHCILEDTIDSSKIATKNYQLPLITPIILYTGNSPWNLVPNFQDHQFDYSYSNKLHSGKLSVSYNFISIHDFSKEELLNMHSMVAFAMAIDKCKQVPELIDTINMVYEQCSTEQKYYLYQMITYLLKPIIPKQLYEGLLKKFNCEEETYMEELIERMKKDLEYRRKLAEQEGLEKGLKKGLKQGLEKGLEKGITKTAINMLKRNMAIEDIADITGLSIEEVRKLKTA